MKSRWILVVISTLLSLLIIEIVSSFFVGYNPLQQAFSVIQADRQLLWKNKENIDSIFYQNKVLTNDLGLRILDQAPQNSIDVLTIGASPTFGWGVDAKSTYSNLLAQMSSKKLTVVNGAMIGHSTFQALKLLPTLLSKYRPKIVTIPFVINDVERLRFVFDSDNPDHLLPPPSALSVVARNLIFHSHFFWLLQSKRNNQLANTPLGQDQVEALLARGPRVPLENYLKNIQKMVEMIKASGARPIILIFPVNLPTQAACQQLATLQQVRLCLAASSSRDSRVYNQELLRMAKLQQLDWIDLRDDLMADPDQHFLVKQKDHIHPSADGHQIIARLLYHYLRDRSLL